MGAVNPVSNLDQGKALEDATRQKFKEDFGGKVINCGMFLDKDIPYLSATPGK